jgi:hypothetical protein
MDRHHPARARLFDGAVDFRVSSGGNQPSAILASEYKYEHTAPWVLRSVIAQQLPIYVSNRDSLA